MNKLNSATGSCYWNRLFSEPDEEISQLLIYNSNRSREQRIQFFSKHVGIINIETSSACNRSCNYCPNSIYDRKKQVLMNDDVWMKILSNIRDINFDAQISLNLYNEPLLDPKIIDRIKQVKDDAPTCYVKFNSNGDFINISLLGRLSDAGLNAIYFTLHTPKEKPYNDQRQLDALEYFFKRLSLPLDIAEHVEGHKIRAKIKYCDLEIYVMSDNWSEYGNDRAGTMEFLKRSSRIAPCMRVFRELTISHKGELFPCCQFFPDAPQSQSHIIGYLSESNIFDIYTSKLAVKWRRMMFTSNLKPPPCTTCGDLDNADSSLNFRREKILSEATISK